jgi:large subunit ribosomal protein L21e
VDVKANPSIQKGMPFKHYHGRTGVIYNVTKRAVGVEVNKLVRARACFVENSPMGRMEG